MTHPDGGSGIGLGLATLLAVLSVAALVLAGALVYGLTGDPGSRAGIPTSTVTGAPAPTPPSS